MSGSRKRHPIRAFFGGLFVGLGVALLLVLYGKIAFGTLTPYVIILAGIVLGVLWAYVAPMRGRGGRHAVPPPDVLPVGPPPEPEPGADAEPEPAPKPAAEPGLEPEPPVAESP